MDEKGNHKIIKTLLLALILSVQQHMAAQPPFERKDTTRVYEKLDALARRSKTTKIVYDLIFKPSGSNSFTSNDSILNKIIPYAHYQGKTIRHIHITTLHPFGYSIADTTTHPRSTFQKTGNQLHIKSRNKTIENLLLIKENQKLDSLRLSETERLIREKKFIRDLAVTIIPVENNPEQVDIHFRILDTWSRIPKISANEIEISDKNFFGLGHHYTNAYEINSDYYKTSYQIGNIGSSFISGSLHLGIDSHGHLNRRLSFDREFFSPLAKWAGGITIDYHSKTDTNGIELPSSNERQFVVSSQDIWAGSSVNILMKNINPLSRANLIFTTRFLRVRYPHKPSDLVTSDNVFSNENFYLGSAGLSFERFVKDRYILKFGVTEDVPVGGVMNFTGGYQSKGSTHRTYWGAKFAFGNYHSWGYLSSNIEYGSFYNKNKSEQGIIVAGINYFTHLKEWGNWRFRQLIKPQYTIGINPFVTDSLTLNDGFGLKSFNSPLLTGTQRLALTLQSQFYAPYNVIGFRLAPFLIWSGAILGNQEDGFKKSKLYSQLGLGVMIRNEYLVLNTFQVSLVFYPSIPGQSENLFKVNPFRTTDFGFDSYKILKPAPVRYQ